MAGFTARIEHGSKTGAHCYGANHSDSGTIGNCDRCGADIVKRDDGKVFSLFSRSGSGARTFACWIAHRCDDIDVVAETARRAALIEAGQIVKGSLVVVARGRKVAKGTLGVVRWIGENGYGDERVGLAIEGVEKLTYTDKKNCDAFIGSPNQKEQKS